MYIFFIVAFLIYFSVNSYIIYKGWQYIAIVFPKTNKKIYFGIMILLSLVYIISMFMIRIIENDFTRFLLSIGTSWIVFFYYSFLFFIVLDILRGIIHFIEPIKKVVLLHKKAIVTTILSVFIIFIIGVFVVGNKIAKSPKVTSYNIDINKEKAGNKKMKIVFISDIHLGVSIGRDRLREIVDIIDGLKPDIVILGGDIIDGDVAPFLNGKMGEEFKRLNPKYGVYGVLGNHEYYGRGGSVQSAIKALQESKVNMLVDGSVLVDNSFYLIGRDDKGKERMGNKRRLGIGDLLKGVDFSKPVILLDHQPFMLQDAYSNGIDLQLSGHTHNGQFWPNNLVTDRMFELGWGYLKKENTHFIVSCGVGTWGPQIRIGSYSEIVEINLNFISSVK